MSRHDRIIRIVTTTRTNRMDIVGFNHRPRQTQGRSESISLVYPPRRRVLFTDLVQRWTSTQPRLLIDWTCWWVCAGTSTPQSVLLSGVQNTAPNPDAGSCPSHVGRAMDGPIHTENAYIAVDWTVLYIPLLGGRVEGIVLGTKRP